MATTLAMDYNALCREVAQYLGWSADSANWDANETARIDGIVRSGYLQYLYPPPIPKDQAILVDSHVWSFLTPTATIDTVATEGETTLPVDFGGMVGNFLYQDAAVATAEIKERSVMQVLQARHPTAATGFPTIFGIRVTNMAGTTAQRREVVWYPTPDTAYTLVYRYTIIPYPLNGEHLLPLGGARYSELLLASCLAVAERRVERARGVQWDAFVEQLRGAVARDVASGQAQTLGGDAVVPTYEHGVEVEVSE